jgi:hypothetical protein
MNKVEWTCFKSKQRQNPKECSDHKVKGKYPKGRPRSIWEQQVRKDVTQMEERSWKMESELWEDKDRWRGLVVRQPT